jgi:hypothetical protein
MAGRVFSTQELVRLVLFLDWRGLLMMRNCLALGAFALTAVALSTAVGGESLKSGLAVGDNPTPFHPLNVTGPYAGKKQCLV